MKRRSLLAALPLALSGCSSVESGGRPPGTFGVPSTTRPPETVTPVADLAVPSLARSVRTQVDDTRGVALSPTLSVAGDGDLSMTAGIRATADERSPLTVWIAVENDAERSRQVAFGAAPPFSGFRGRPLDGDLDSPLPLLVPSRRRSTLSSLRPDSPSDGAWVATGAFEAPDASRQSVVEMAPGESVAGEYELLWPRGSAGPPRRAVYRFDDDAADRALGLAVWDPALAERGASRFDRTVSPLPGSAATDWYHDGTASYYLGVERERLRLPLDRARFLLSNFSPRPLPATPRWRLFKHHDAGWKQIAPWGDRGSGRTIPPGGVRALSLTVGNGRRQIELPDYPGYTFPNDDVLVESGYVNERVAVDGVGPGLYALWYGDAPRGEGDPGPFTVVGRQTVGLGGGPTGHVGEWNQRGGGSSGSDTEDKSGGPTLGSGDGSRQRGGGEIGRIGTPAQTPNSAGAGRTGPRAIAALFEVAGEPPRLTPTDDVTRIEPVDGGSDVGRTDVGVVVSVDRPEAAGGGSLRLERADAGSVVVIREQVLATPALRNGIVAAVSTGADRVLVETSAGRVSEPFARFAPDGRPAPFTLSFEGRAYRVAPVDDLDDR